MNVVNCDRNRQEFHKKLYHIVEFLNLTISIKSMNMSKFSYKYIVSFSVTIDKFIRSAKIQLDQVSKLYMQEQCQPKTR